MTSPWGCAAKVVYARIAHAPSHRQNKIPRHGPFNNNQWVRDLTLALSLLPRMKSRLDQTPSRASERRIILVGRSLYTHGTRTYTRILCLTITWMMYHYHLMNNLEHGDLVSRITEAKRWVNMKERAKRKEKSMEKVRLAMGRWRIQGNGRNRLLLC